MPQNTPIIYVVLGATGDLAQKKIMPALLALFSKDKLPEHSKIIAYSRRPWSSQQYRDFIQPHLERDGIHENKDTTARFLQHLEYVEGNFEVPADYKKLAARIQEIKEKNNLQENADIDTLIHFSVQPSFYEEIIKNLADADIEGKFLVEKPFGHDLASALALEKHIEHYFGTENAAEKLYRIDHYLGKQGMWNMYHERQHDHALEETLTRKHVQSICVRIFEKIGIEGRGEFYDSTGALRDVVENHALEMLAMATFDISGKEFLQEARAAVLQALKPVAPENIVAAVSRGQYEGYILEEDVPKKSAVETYIAITTEIANPRWSGVPIELKAGKALPEKRSEVEFTFKDGSKKIFDMEYVPEHVSSAVSRVPHAYEVVIEAAVSGDKKYFVGMDEVIASWKFVTPILQHLNELELKTYTQGTMPA